MPHVYFAFDLLYLDGEELIGLSLIDRKTRVVSLGVV
jgi:ATP-dependent DNA ligase